MLGADCRVLIFLMPKSSKTAAKVLSSKIAFHGPIFDVATQQVREPGGYVARRDIVQHPGSVVILAVDEAQARPRVLLEWQYRHAAKSFLLERPAGNVH